MSYLKCTMMNSRVCCRDLGKHNAREMVQELTFYLLKAIRLNLEIATAANGKASASIL